MYFTRGSSHDRYAKYSEEGDVYQDNVQRLLRKFESAKNYVPQPVIRPAKEKTSFGVIHFGSTAAAMREALASLDADGLHLDVMRLRAFPFTDAVADFINSHDQVFLVEQNRDAQMRMLLVNECGIDPAKFVSVLHFDGTPITARFIIEAISARMRIGAKEAAE
jgi:2-oxoglutarate ferredoxin oxidoreductase subunit alpha